MKFFRRNGSNQGAVPKGEINFERACREIEDLVAHREIDDLVKSKRRASSVREMSDAKDYDDENLDDFDRRPSARRRRDMDATYPGLQAMDEMLSDADDHEDEDLSHEMLVSGRPSRVRFPGSRGDSTLEPVEYIHDESDEDGELDGQDRIAERNRYGGDALARRMQRKARGVGDSYMTGKSRSYRPRRALSFELIKSRLQDAMADGNLDPTILLNFASNEVRCGIDLGAQMRALATIPPEVRRRYRLPEDLGVWEEQGSIRRELSAA